MIELRKRTFLKIAVGSVFICSFILALMYPAIFAKHKDKIYFLMSPNPHAVFTPPPSKEADIMYVWVAVVKDSTYGSFTMALVSYETYYTEYAYYEYHWYTDRKVGETLAYIHDRLGQMWEEEEYPIVLDSDVSVAKIDVTTSEHQLIATVRVKDKTLFTVGFCADMSVPIESRIRPLPEVAQELCLGVSVYRPTLQASVTGMEVGDFIGGRFEYIDTELYDSSLLP